MDPFLERALAEAEEPTATQRTIRILASDGFALSGTHYAAAARRRGSVIVNSATGVQRRYYAAFARFLAIDGFDVVTYDYRGIGDSLPVPIGRLHARMRHWGERDLAAAIDWARAELGDASPRVIGHSVGGQIVGLAPNNERIQAMLFVGAQSGEWRFWKGMQRARMLALWYGVIPPVTSFLGYLPGAIFGGESLPAGVAREWARWGRRRGYVVGGGDAGRTAAYARIRAPLLAYSFSDDQYAPRAAVDALLALYSGAERTHRHVEPGQVGRRAIGHFGFFRRPQRDPFWHDARDWLRGAAR
jgi:predicted alpha/beta hydrolase